MLSLEALLQKAVLNVTGPGGDVGTADFGGVAQAPLSIEQVKEFIVLMSTQQVMLGQVRTVTSGSAKWQESVIGVNDRVMHAGIEATRLAASDRGKPATQIVELSTVLLRGEYPVSDEVMEDNVAGTQVVQYVQSIMGDRAGFDIEDLMVNGDTTTGDPYYGLLDGWLKQAADNGHAFSGASFGQDYQAVFNELLKTLPYRYLRNLADYRFFVPKRIEQKYRDILASRIGTYGDAMLTGTNGLTYQGIEIVGVPSFAIASGSPDTSSILFANKNSLYAGYHRQIKMETWRDPREGATSFVLTARVDAKVAVPDAAVIATSVDVS
jgi:hypothetical protein